MSDDRTPAQEVDVARVVLDHDVMWPRDRAHRYRVYVLAGGILDVLFACPDPGGIGQGIVQFDLDQKEQGQRLGDLGRLGVLDVLSDEEGGRGEWIVNPFDRVQR